MINRVVFLPRMVCNVWALCIVLQISLVFLPSSFKAYSSFSYVVPRTVFARDFLDNIALECTIGISLVLKAWGRYRTIDCYVKRTTFTLLLDNITKLYMVPIFSCYPSGTILFRTKAICSKHMHRLISISVNYMLGKQYISYTTIHER